MNTRILQFTCIYLSFSLRFQYSNKGAALFSCLEEYELVKMMSLIANLLDFV